MKKNIFYSWQSDLENSANRGFIEKAIGVAVTDLLKSGVAVDPIIDRDTKGEPGSPDISATIFEKIDRCGVYICDVSIIDRNATRPGPNPNVLLELGYAIAKLGWSRVIMVKNLHYGKIEELPFDLRSKRVLSYELDPKNEDKSSERNSLRKTLTTAIQIVLEKHVNTDSDEEIVVPVKVKKSDIKLFLELKTDLPTNGSINFVDQTNMAGFSFPLKKLEQLHNFVEKWSQVEFEFVDPEAESVRKDLLNATNAYLATIGYETFPTHEVGYNSVPLEWEDTQPKRFWDTVGKLHEQAAKVVELHRQIMRIGKNKFED